MTVEHYLLLYSQKALPLIGYGPLLEIQNIEPESQTVQGAAKQLDKVGHDHIPFHGANWTGSFGLL